MFRETITLFNYHKDTNTWYPTVLFGVDFGSTKAGKKSVDGNVNQDAVIALINCTKNKVVKDIFGNEKSYTEPKAYGKSEEPAAYITFTPGCDFIYHGIWPGSEPVKDDEYESGYYHAMNKEYDGVYLISSAEFYGLLPHFEIGGK